MASASAPIGKLDEATMAAHGHLTVEQYLERQCQTDVCDCE